jgi:hypothetical protein
MPLRIHLPPSLISVAIIRKRRRSKNVRNGRLQLASLGTIKNKLRELRTQNKSLDTYTSRGLLYLLYVTHSVCGGALDLSENEDAQDAQDALTIIIQKGVARLSRSQTHLRIVDKLVVDGIQSLVSDEDKIKNKFWIPFDKVMLFIKQSFRMIILQKVLSKNVY